MDQLGVPTYDELVLVARRSTVDEHPEAIRSFITALAEGTSYAIKHPQQTANTVLAAGMGLDPTQTRAEVDATLPLLAGAKGHPYGFMDPDQWREYAEWMVEHDLISSAPRTSDMLTNALLPFRRPSEPEGRLPSPCASPRARSSRHAPKRCVRGEVLLDLGDRCTTAEAGEVPDELDVGQVAGRQRVRLATAVQPEALHRPRTDLRDRHQPAVRRGVEEVGAPAGDLPGAVNHRHRPALAQIHRRGLRRSASRDHLGRRYVAQRPERSRRRSAVGGSRR